MPARKSGTVEAAMGDPEEPDEPAGRQSLDPWPVWPIGGDERLGPRPSLPGGSTSKHTPT
jgi:hypothetical protein